MTVFQDWRPQLNMVAYYLMGAHASLVVAKEIFPVPLIPELTNVLILHFPYNFLLRSKTIA